MTSPGEKFSASKLLFAIFLLTLLIFVVYAQTRSFGFVNYDDPAYITENLELREGLSAKGISWAFTTTYLANWTPITWLSYLLDYQLGGLDARGYHITNILFHLLNSILLLIFLWVFSRDFWPSLVVSSFFAVHPLHVESVAWISERKDVVSASFFLLGLIVYASYVKNRRDFAYASSALCFILGFLAKPMVVTFPFVLWLVDLWPLNRLEGRSLLSRDGVKRSLLLLAEKIPLLILAALMCALVLWVQERGEARRSFTEFPLYDRIANALTAYGAYVWKSVWPAGLAVHYPPPAAGVSYIWAGLSLLAVLAVSAGALLSAKAKPYVFTGWFWFLGMLVPVIGIVQVGGQSMADRYTYLPQVGLCILVCWAAWDWAGDVARRRYAAGLAAAVGIAVLTVAARGQTHHWRDSIALFEHTLAVTKDNPTAHINLGAAYLSAGRPEESIAHSEAAIALNTDEPDGWLNLGLAQINVGRLDEAVATLAKTIELAPNSATAHNYLGVALLDSGDLTGAQHELEAALALDPQFLDAHNNLGNVLLRIGDFDGAINEYALVLKAEPEQTNALSNMGAALLAAGRIRGAISFLERAVDLAPEDALARVNLAAAFYGRGDLEAALNHCRLALEAQPGNALAQALMSELQQAIARGTEAAP